MYARETAIKTNKKEEQSKDRKDISTGSMTMSLFTLFISMLLLYYHIYRGSSVKVTCYFLCQLKLNSNLIK